MKDRFLIRPDDKTTPDDLAPGIAKWVLQQCERCRKQMEDDRLDDRLITIKNELETIKEELENAIRYIGSNPEGSSNYTFGSKILKTTVDNLVDLVVEKVFYRLDKENEELLARFEMQQKDLVRSSPKIGEKL